MNSPLSIDAMFVAEYVRFSADGTLSAIAIFDKLIAPTLPSTITFTLMCHVVAFEADDTGWHRAQVLILDPDGRIVNRYHTAIFLPPVVENGISTAWFGARFEDASVESHGVYTAQVSLDDRPVGSLSVPVRPRLQAPSE